MQPFAPSRQPSITVRPEKALLFPCLGNPRGLPKERADVAELVDARDLKALYVKYSLGVNINKNS
jgi:hypothetical protein